MGYGGESNCFFEWWKLKSKLEGKESCLFFGEVLGGYVGGI